MEYYLPQEEDVDRLNDAFEQPIGDEIVQQIRTMSGEDSNNNQIEDIFPVSSRHEDTADTQNAHYSHIRTYEVVSMQTAPTKEVLVTFREEESEEGHDGDDVFDEPSRRKRKGVFFKEINVRTLLRKTRAKVSAPEGCLLMRSDEGR